MSRPDADPKALERAERAGRLVRLFPRVYVDSAQYQGLRRASLRQRAAMRYIGPRGALSHTTAVDLWDLRVQPHDEPIHATVARETRLRSCEGLVVHRRTGFEASLRTWRHGLTVVTRDLVDLLASGCRSPLEIWGALHVFTGPGMPTLRRQFAVAVGGKVFYLDLFAPAEKVAFELDGAAFHGNQTQREADIRRDGLLATIGIQVIRFSYRRLVSEPDAVRAEALKILASRRRS